MAFVGKMELRATRQMSATMRQISARPAGLHLSAAAAGRRGPQHTSTVSLGRTENRVSVLSRPLPPPRASVSALARAPGETRDARLQRRPPPRPVPRALRPPPGPVAERSLCFFSSTRAQARQTPNLVLEAAASDVVETVEAPEVSDREAVAYLRNLRGSPNKVRRVLDAIRGMSYEEALMALEFMPYRACDDILKVLYSVSSATLGFVSAPSLSGPKD